MRTSLPAARWRAERPPLCRARKRAFPDARRTAASAARLVRPVPARSPRSRAGASAGHAGALPATRAPASRRGLPPEQPDHRSERPPRRPSPLPPPTGRSPLQADFERRRGKDPGPRPSPLHPLRPPGPRARAPAPRTARRRPRRPAAPCPRTPRSRRSPRAIFVGGHGQSFPEVSRPHAVAPPMAQPQVGQIGGLRESLTHPIGARSCAGGPPPQHERPWRQIPRARDPSPGVSRAARGVGHARRGWPVSPASRVSGRAQVLAHAAAPLTRRGRVERGGRGWGPLVAVPARRPLCGRAGRLRAPRAGSLARREDRAHVRPIRPRPGRRPCASVQG